MRSYLLWKSSRISCSVVLEKSKNQLVGLVEANATIEHEVGLIAGSNKKCYWAFP